MKKSIILFLLFVISIPSFTQDSVSENPRRFNFLKKEISLDIIDTEKNELIKVYIDHFETIHNDSIYRVAKGLCVKVEKVSLSHETVMITETVQEETCIDLDFKCGYVNCAGQIVDIDFTSDQILIVDFGAKGIAKYSYESRSFRRID
jgi:hypothetical protein